MKSTFFTLGICLVLWGCSCKKENNEPEQKKPEPTTDGRNTFYCEINGVPYYQRFVGGLSDFPRITGSYSLLDSGHALNFDLKYQNKEYDFFLAFTILEKDISKIVQFVPFRTSSVYYANKKNSCNYFSSIVNYGSYSGFLKFSRFDPQNNIFSGTFQFKNWLPDSVKGGCDTVKVTNGIFDLRL
jgi:hypothetical protein